MDDGFKLYWEQSNYQAGGRKVELVTADTTCNPDQALTQARRLVHQEKVHFIVGPLCGHEGPAVAQVSKETGIPVVMDPAGADNVTQVGPHADRHPYGDVVQPDRPSFRRLPLQGAWRPQRHLHRPGLHLRPRGRAGRGGDLQGSRRQGRQDHLEPDRHQGLRRRPSPPSTRRPTPLSPSWSAQTASACSKPGSTSAWTRSTKSTAATGCTRTRCRRWTTAPSA